MAELSPGEVSSLPEQAEPMHVTTPAPKLDTIRVLISLPSMNDSARRTLISRLATLAGHSTLVIATPDELSEDASSPATELVSYTPDATPAHTWALTAVEYRNAATLVATHHCNAAVILGEEAESLSEAGLGALLGGALRQDAALTLPRYTLGPNEGLVNAAILYPLTTSLYGVPARFPLPLDVAVSAPLAARLAAASRARSSDALLWPVAEAVAAGLPVTEVECGRRAVPVPAPTQDLNVLLSTVVGSLFSDAESKANVWQRSRTRLPSPGSIANVVTAHTSSMEEVAPLVSGFCNAHNNLHELWSLVLPPQTQLGLKRLAASSSETFHMPDELWVRIVYDFLLAHRLRTLNQSHLLGALTPIYLAWVASHVLLTVHDAGKGEEHIARLSEAFQRDKPYLLSRWRWPDRFNP